MQPVTERPMSAFPSISVAVFRFSGHTSLSGEGSLSFISMAGIEDGRVEDLPRVCEGCYMSYGDSVDEDCEVLVKLLMKPQLFLGKKAAC